ncbi:MAG: DUF993 family protein [Acetobacteraceae bacterium]|nr:DUF993 family protein [Acetobacteraceae bacterium]
MPTLTLPGPGRSLQRYTTQPPRLLPQGGPPFNRLALTAAHIVADPLSDRPAIDWDATIDYRLYLWSLGLGIAEATDMAQRGAGLDWLGTLDLIRRSLAAAPPGAALFCAASTDHLPSTATIAQVVGAYEAQCDSIEKLGGRIILLASRALAANARSADDYKRAYGRILSQTRSPVLLHWPGALFDPALANYWGHASLDDALATCLDIITDNAAKIDGIAFALLDPAREVALRRHLPRGVRLYTGDELHFPELIAGDDDSYSHAMLGILDVIAPAAAAALACLQRDDVETFRQILEPTLPVARHLLRPPACLFGTGVVLMAYLNAHQSHFTMLSGQHSARSLPYLAELFRLADSAGLLRDPDDATARMARVLAVGGVT